MSKIKELVMRLEEADLPIENESVELLTARDRLIDAVEQEKAQREYDIEKALKEATVLQLLGEIERRDDE